MSTDKTANYGKNFKYNNAQSTYAFQIKRRNWWWLWLLLALVLFGLLFIRCERDITVQAFDVSSAVEPTLPDVQVSMGYNEYYLYKQGRFFGRDHVQRTATTDADGKAVFEKLPCSVFSYIFTFMTRATYQAQSNCYELDPDPTTSLFHFTRYQRLEMLPLLVDLPWRVIDKISKEPLTNAQVQYRYTVGGQEHNDSVRTDPNGECLLRGVPKCGELLLTRVSCYAYNDTTNIEWYVPDVLDNPDLAVTPLEPEQGSFTVFVKNKLNRQAIPNARVDLTIQSPKGNYTKTDTAYTNISGAARGSYGYNNAALVYNLDMVGSARHYKSDKFYYVDTQGKSKSPYTVEEFIKLPDSLRVIYLEPEPYSQQFQNIDSLTREPVRGAFNRWVVTAGDGTQHADSAYANDQGYFNIVACDGDKIEIVSTHRYYEDKHTAIDSFYTGQKIPMMPKKVDLMFRTVDCEDNELLPDCSLKVSTSLSGVNTPTNSGNGEFVVRGVYYTETITIVASKPDYATNNTKISNAKVSHLVNAYQDRRDIPLCVDLPPCNANGAGQENLPAGSRSAPQSYNMGQKSGTFTISYGTGSVAPDQIFVYNHAPNERYDVRPAIWTSGMVTGDHTANISFNQGSVITIVVVTGPEDGSIWDYHISCPQ